MLATAKKYDLIFLQLRNHSSQLEDPFKKDVDNLFTDIKAVISKKNEIKSSIDNMLGDLFNLRVKALRWLAENDEIILSEMLEEVYQQIEELKNNPHLEILADNLLFALRCNKKVVEALMKAGGISKESFHIERLDLPELTYDQFKTLIILGTPDNSIAQKIINWTNSSLYIEFILVAAVMISDEGIKPKKETIDELAFLAADAAQEYIATAIQMGLLKSHSSKESFSHINFDDEFIDEQKQLADLGLADYNSTIGDS